MNRKNIILTVIAVFFLIPIVLNFILPVRTGLIVIGGSESTKLWLQFWATYIGGFGAAAASIVALYNEYKNRKRNDLKYELDSLKEEYNFLEREVLNAEEVHSISNAIRILRNLESGDFTKAQEEQQKWLFQGRGDQAI